MNHVTLMGRLTRDPELRHTQSGLPVASFSIAVDRPVAQGEEKKADFIDVVAWRKNGEFAVKWLGKGKRCLVEGSLQKREYEARDGGKRWAVEVIANKLTPIDWPDKDGAQAKPPGNMPNFNDINLDDDVPF